LHHSPCHTSLYIVYICISDASDRAPYRGARCRCVITLLGFTILHVFHRNREHQEGRRERAETAEPRTQQARRLAIALTSCIASCVLFGARETTFGTCHPKGMADTSALKGLFGPNESPACCDIGASLRSHLQPRTVCSPLNSLFCPFGICNNPRRLDAIL